MANYRQKTIAEKIAKLVAKIERLPQPMSKELLEKCKQAIIEEAILMKTFILAKWNLVFRKNMMRMEIFLMFLIHHFHKYGLNVLRL